MPPSRAFLTTESPPWATPAFAAARRRRRPPRRETAKAGVDVQPLARLPPPIDACGRRRARAGRRTGRLLHQGCATRQARSQTKSARSPRMRQRLRYRFFARRSTSERFQSRPRREPVERSRGMLALGEAQPGQTWLESGPWFSAAHPPTMPLAVNYLPIYSKSSPKSEAETIPLNSGQATMAAEPSPNDPRTFRVFRDSNGMYKWTLTDRDGRRVQMSRFGFATLAGAFRDIEVLRSQHGYETTVIRDETGRWAT